MVSNGTFRSDLFYRLNVFTVCIPPLRERTDDISYLAHHFFKEFSFKYNKSTPFVHQKATERLNKYSWPGNIRELRNIIERLIVLHEGHEIYESDILKLLPQAKSFSPPVNQAMPSLTDERESLEKTRILQTLQQTYGNKSITAKKLGMSRANLYKKIKKYGITFDKTDI